MQQLWVELSGFLKKRICYAGFFTGFSPHFTRTLLRCSKPPLSQITVARRFRRHVNLTRGACIWTPDKLRPTTRAGKIGAPYKCQSRQKPLWLVYSVVRHVRPRRRSEPEPVKAPIQTWGRRGGRLQISTQFDVSKFRNAVRLLGASGKSPKSPTNLRTN